MENIITSRFGFRDIFQDNYDGSLSPKRDISINGITFGPSVSFQKGVFFGGIDLHLYKYKDIAAHEDNGGVLVIDGFYE